MLLETPAFVIASRKPGDADSLVRQILEGSLVDYPIGVFVAPSIFEAYEAGRKAFSDRKRIVYLHNDVDILNPGAFLGAIASLTRRGLYGVIGSSNPECDVRGWWWEYPPLKGMVMQGGNGDPYVVAYDGCEASPVTWLDGLCLVTVDQSNSWTWKLPGNPQGLWHGYDLFAAKRTRSFDGVVEVIPQPPGEPFLRHNGYGRIEKGVESLEIVRSLSRSVVDRRDYPNICEHLPRFRREARGTVLELGCREGASTGALLEGVETHGGSVVSVDIDDCSSAWRGHPRWYFVQCQSTDKKKVLEKMAENGVIPLISVLVIDTEHDYDLCSRELRAWFPHMEPGGVILIHDTEEFPEMFEAVQDFIGEHRDELDHEFIKGCSGLSVLKLKDGAPKERAGTSFSLKQMETYTEGMTISPVALLLGSVTPRHHLTRASQDREAPRTLAADPRPSGNGAS